VPAPCSFDYAILRVVPRVEREEFLNVGVVIHCFQRGFLTAATALDPARLAAFAPGLDPRFVQEHLDAVVRIAAGGADAGPIGRLAPKERFRWLVAPRSTILQPSPVHAGLCTDPAKTLDHLLDTMVRLP
jgi:hypothetical protein